MILVVCGGRNFADRAEIWKYLDAIRRKKGIELLVHGDCGTVDEKTGRVVCGADLLSGVWAQARGVPVKTYPANWDKLGDAAGPIRNGEMLRDAQPNGLAAFPGDKGTRDCIRQARELGIPVMLCGWEG